MVQHYFNAILLRSGSVTPDELPVIIPYPTSSMGCNLMVIRAHIGKARLILMNTHLETKKWNSSERMKQLKLCFHYMLYEDPSESSIIFGGDLNLRDSELHEIGGIPSDIRDLWVTTGCKQDFKYTWDLMQNTNLTFPSSHPHRFRFDRLYFRASSLIHIKPSAFNFAGTEKVAGTQSFPSDHWGISVKFLIPVSNNIPTNYLVLC